MEKKGNLLFRNCASSDLRRSLLHSVQRKSGQANFVPRVLSLSGNEAWSGCVSLFVTLVDKKRQSNRFKLCISWIFIAHY